MRDVIGSSAVPANVNRGSAAGVALVRSGSPEHAWFRDFLDSALKRTINHDMVRHKIDLLFGDIIIYKCYEYIGKSPLGTCFHHSELIDDPSQLPSLVFVFCVDCSGEVNSSGIRRAQFKEYTVKVHSDGPICCEFDVLKTVDELPKRLYRVIDDQLTHGGTSPQLGVVSIINGLNNPEKFPAAPNFRLLLQECQNYLCEFKKYTSAAQKALVRDECQASVAYLLRSSASMYNFVNTNLPANTVKYYDQIRNRLTMVTKLLMGGINKKLTKDEITNGYLRQIIKTFFKVTDNNMVPFNDCLTSFSNCPFKSPDGVFLITEETYEYLISLGIVKSAPQAIMHKNMTTIKLSDDDFHPMSALGPRKLAEKRVIMSGTTDWVRNEDNAFHKYTVDTPMSVSYMQNGDQFILLTPLTEKQFESTFLDNNALTGKTAFDTMVPVGINPFLNSYPEISSSAYYTDQHDTVHRLKMGDFEPWFESISKGKLSIDRDHFRPSSYPFHRPSLETKLYPAVKKKTSYEMCDYVIESYYCTRSLVLANAKNMYKKYHEISSIVNAHEKKDINTLFEKKICCSSRFTN